MYETWQVLYGHLVHCTAYLTPLYILQNILDKSNNNLY